MPTHWNVYDFNLSPCAWLCGFISQILEGEETKFLFQSIRVLL